LEQQILSFSFINYSFTSSFTSSFKVKGSSVSLGSSAIVVSPTFEDNSSTAAIFFASGIFLVLLDGRIAIPLLEI
jgi:hypothetical protein